MINIDEIRSMQEAGVKAENAKKVAWREERRKRTEERIPYFEGKIKEAAGHGEGSWTADSEICEGKNGYDWVFLKRYFEGLGFFVSMTYDECDYIWFTVAWSEKETEKLREDIRYYEKCQSENAGKKKGFFSKLFG